MLPACTTEAQPSAVTTTDEKYFALLLIVHNVNILFCDRCFLIFIWVWLILCYAWANQSKANDSVARFQHVVFGLFINFAWDLPQVANNYFHPAHRVLGEAGFFLFFFLIFLSSDIRSSSLRSAYFFSPWQWWKEFTRINFGRDILPLLFFGLTCVFEDWNKRAHEAIVASIYHTD